MKYLIIIFLSIPLIGNSQVIFYTRFIGMYALDITTEVSLKDTSLEISKTINTTNSNSWDYALHISPKQSNSLRTVGDLLMKNDQCILDVETYNNSFSLDVIIDVYNKNYKVIKPNEKWIIKDNGREYLASLNFNKSHGTYSIVYRLYSPSQ